MRIDILNAYYQQTNFIFRVLDLEATNHPSNLHASPIPPSPQDICSLRRCTHCREMPSEVEKRCCTFVTRSKVKCCPWWCIENNVEQLISGCDFSGLILDHSSYTSNYVGWAFLKGHGDDLARFYFSIFIVYNAIMQFW